MVAAWNMSPSDALKATPGDFWRWYMIKTPLEQLRAKDVGMGAGKSRVPLNHERLLRAARAHAKAQEKQNKQANSKGV